MMATPGVPTHGPEDPPTWLGGAHVAVILPCFNEAPRIAAVLASVPAWVRTVVVVDDASSDTTCEVARSVGDPRVVVEVHPRNRGVGAATCTGYRVAQALGADICVKMDGDGQMAAEDLPALLEPILAGRADYSKGNRFHDLDALDRMPWVRRLGNSVLSFLIKLVSGYWSIFDPTNGYTAIRSDTLRRLRLDQLSEHYFFETSILVELNIRGAVVEDVPMPARYGEETSSLRIGRVIRQFPPLMVRGLCRRLFWRYLVYDFSVVTVCVLGGLPLLLFGAVFGAMRWYRSTVTGVPASAGTTILAALPVMLGVQLLLVATVLDLLLEPKTRRGQPPFKAPRA